jgi:aminomethyltransferase
MSVLQKTVLFEEHVRRGGRMVPFAGWTMPVQYTSILEEYEAVRGRVGIFDVSHMGQVRVTGKEALQYMRFLLTNDVGRCRKGQSMYSPMCYPDGGVVDDLIVYYVDDHEFFVVVNASNTARDVDWMREQVRELEVEISDESPRWGLLALQGPKAEAVLAAVHPQDIAKMPYRSFLNTKIYGEAAVIARTGYTGEDGFEIYVATDRTAGLWNELLSKGEPHGILPCGLGARDLLRLEMGYALYGHELDEQHSPLASGVGWAVKWENHEFLGRDALEDEKERGSPETLVYFSLSDRRIPRDKSPIFVDGQQLGAVVSGGFSPRLGHSIGAGFLKWNTKTKGPLPAVVEIQIRDTLMKGKITSTPFITGTSLKKARLAKTP